MKIFKSPTNNSSGYTVTEIFVAFGIFVILTSLSFAFWYEYKKKSYNTAAKDLVLTLEVAVMSQISEGLLDKLDGAKPDWGSNWVDEAWETGCEVSGEHFGAGGIPNPFIKKIPVICEYTKDYWWNIQLNYWHGPVYDYEVEGYFIQVKHRLSDIIYTLGVRYDPPNSRVLHRVMPRGNLVTDGW